MHQQEQIPTGDMPVMTAHNDMVARVLARHSIDQVTLALKAQCSESTISRIIGNSRPVTSEIIRALWDLTGDPDIIAVTLGRPNLICIEQIEHTADPQHDNQMIDALAVRNCAKVLSDHGKPPRNRNEAMTRIKQVDATVASLCALRAKLARVAHHHATHPCAQAPVAYRAVNHPTAPRVDAVA